MSVLKYINPTESLSNKLLVTTICAFLIDVSIDNFRGDINDIINNNGGKSISKKVDNILNENDLKEKIINLVNKELKGPDFKEKLENISNLEGIDYIQALYHLIFTELFPLILAGLYTIAYFPTLRKIHKDKVPVDSTSFSHFAIVSAGLGLNNGFQFGSIGYFTTFVLATTAVYLNEKTQELIKEGKAVPNIPGIKEKNDIIEALKESHIGLSSYDINGNVLEWSQEMEELTGYTKKDIINSNPLDLFYPIHEDIDNERAKVESFLSKIKSGENYTEVFNLKTKGGDRKKIKFSTTPIFNQNKEVIGSNRLATEYKERKNID